MLKTLGNFREQGGEIRRIGKVGGKKGGGESLDSSPPFEDLHA